MAITAATKTSDFDGFLNPNEAAPIFNEAQRQSVFQQLFRRVPLGINGESIPVVTSRPTANWVDEAGKKPATSMGLGLVPMVPKKLAAIAVMSAEVVRANPGNFTSQLRTELAGAFARAFDLAVAYNAGGDGTPAGGPFDYYLNDTSKRVTLGTATATAGGLHTDIVNGMKDLIADGRKLTGFALDDRVEPLLWGAVDSVGHPVYVNLPTDDVTQAIARPGRLLGRPSFMGDGVGNGSVVAFGGDFTKGAWGAVGGISYRVSTEATVTINNNLVSLWEHNLVAVLAEAEYGFVLADEDAEDFVAYEYEAGSGASA